MKKTILSLMLAGLSAGAYAQGTVTFANVPMAPAIGVQTNGVATPAGSYTVALYWDSAANAAGPGIDAGSSSLVLQKIYLDNPADFPVPGKFNGGTVTVNGLAGQAAGFFEVVGWTGNFADYATALATPGTYIGASPIFANGTGGGSPPLSPANLTGWNGTLILSQVPEPATIALGGLGAAALLLFRRRK